MLCEIQSIKTPKTGATTAYPKELHKATLVIWAAEICKL